MATQTGSIDLKAAKKSYDDAAKVATDYVADITNGILVHPSGDSDNGVKITDKVEIMRGSGGSSETVAEFGTEAIVGKQEESHVKIKNDSVALKYEDDRLFEVSYDGTDVQLYFASTSLVTHPAPGCKYTNVKADEIYDFIVDECHLDTDTGKILLNADDSDTGYYAIQSGSEWYVRDPDGDEITCGEYGGIYRIGSSAWAKDYWLAPKVEIPGYVYMNACEGAGDFSFIGGFFMDCPSGSDLYNAIVALGWDSDVIV